MKHSIITAMILSIVTISTSFAQGRTDHAASDPQPSYEFVASNGSSVRVFYPESQWFIRSDWNMVILVDGESEQISTDDADCEIQAKRINVTGLPADSDMNIIDHNVCSVDIEGATFVITPQIEARYNISSNTAGIIESVKKFDMKRVDVNDSQVHIASQN